MIDSDALYLQGFAVMDDFADGDYVAGLPVVRSLIETGEFTFKSPVTIFVGENGVGKSTLIEALAVCSGFNPEGGTVNFAFSTRASHSSLHEHLRLSRGYKHRRDGFFLRAESMYNVASNIDELDEEPGGGPPIKYQYGGVSLHEQSHGESFLAVVENRFGGNGLYILDEPEAALSPMRTLRLMVNMKELVDKESQFIISTHSPMLMAFPGADVLQIGDGGIERVDYRETEHYQVMKMFLDCPERMLTALFSEDG